MILEWDGGVTMWTITTPIHFTSEKSDPILRQMKLHLKIGEEIQFYCPCQHCVVIQITYNKLLH